MSSIASAIPGEGRSPPRTRLSTTAMKNRTLTQTASRRDFLRSTGLAAGGVLLGGSALSGSAAAGGSAPGSVPGQANVLEIVALHDHDTDEMAFELSTTEFPAGWTTLEFDNQTSHTHHTYLSKIPPGAIAGAEAAGMELYDYYVEQIVEPFQGFMDYLLGKTPRHAPVLPEWFDEILPSGGNGLTTPQEVSATTIDLDPGKYFLECYIKNAENEFHGYLGMAAILTVTEAESDASEPGSTFDIAVSTAGFDTPESVRPGQHTVGITFEDQDVYGNLVGHDAHLIRFDDDTTVDDVNGWMNWMSADGFVSDGSEPGTFVGGAETIFAPGLLDSNGTVTAYAHVNLRPGDYAWVAEVPEPMSKGLLVEFTVPDQD